MRLGKKQRAQVVELLRCAADLGINHNQWCPVTEVGHRLGLIYYGLRAKDDRHDGLLVIADEAIGLTPFEDNPPGLASWVHFGFCCLEAAARVEEGSWPASRSKPHV